MNVYARRIPQAIAHPSSAANESPGWSGRQPPPTGAESASRLATSRGRLGHARARVGPQNAPSGPEKWASGPEKWASRPARVAQSGRFGVEWGLCCADSLARRSPKGDSGRHRGDSDPPRPTRGADSLARRTPARWAHSLGRVGAWEADSRRGGWRLGAASRPGRVPLGGRLGPAPHPGAATSCPVLRG
jgi:hypothetical protein